ncbi:MAG: hypothetical protein WC291_09490 [Thermodesulfovibrionales bacterium]|jgi:hypothetical protein
MKDLDRIRGLVPEWGRKYGIGQFTYERFCQWVVETRPDLAAEALAGLLRGEAKK